MTTTDRTLLLPIRLTPQERKTFDAAAAAMSLPTGTWMRMVALQAAQRPTDSPPAPKGPRGKR